MATTEQFSLRWNNFHSNLTTGFHDLLEAADMVDVTLAVEGQFLQAHKIVLSICSPYFKQMFKISPCKHPIIILKDVAHDNMKDILEFMYLGEVNVLRENLPSFLRTAELLQVKGLTGDDSQSETSSKKDDKIDSLADTEDDQEYNQIIEADAMLTQFTTSTQPTSPSKSQNNIKRQARTSLINTNSKKTKSESSQNKISQINKSKTESSKSDEEVQFESSSTIKTELPYETEEPREAIKNYDGNTNNAGLSIDSNSQDHGKYEEKITKNAYRCEKCYKMFTRRDHLRTHEKNIHGEDVGPFACIMCSQLYKNAESLRKHIAKFHYQKTTTESQSKIQVSNVVMYSVDEKGHAYCPYCFKKFVNRYNLKVHIRDKHDTNSSNLGCVICGKTMRNRSCLRVHMYHHRKQEQAKLEASN